MVPDDFEWWHRLHDALHHPDPQRVADVLAEHAAAHQQAIDPDAAASADVEQPPPPKE